MVFKIALLILIYYVTKYFFRGVAMYQQIKASHDQMQKQGSGQNSEQTRAGAQSSNSEAINAEFTVLNREE